MAMLIGAVHTGILRPLLTLADILQFFSGLGLALLPAGYVVLTKGTKPLTRLDSLFKFLKQFPCGGALFSLMTGIASPYSASIRPRFLKVEKDECKACMQDRPWLRNPFNSLHAIALANLAELTSAVGMLTAAQYERGLRVIPVKVECEYLKKARGTVTATARYELPANKQDGVVTFPVLLHDKKGELVASAVVHWKLSYKHNDPRSKLQGVVFPVTPQGDRSTTVEGKRVFAAAVGAVDKEAAARVEAERNWRFGYSKHVVANMLVSARSEAAALAVANAGLDAMYTNMQFIASDGTSLPFAEALEKGANRFHTHTLVGQKKKIAGSTQLSVPYRQFHSGKEVLLQGEALERQVDSWVAYGTIEADCGEAIKEVLRNPQWCDLSGRFFVLLGASSAMGPLRLLTELGAHIIAVDIDRPHVWKSILETVENSSATVTFAMKEPFNGQSGDDLHRLCGANILNDTPDLCMWLKECIPKVCGGKPVTVGGYAYLDGELHVRVNLACDAIISSIISSYGAHNTHLAFLCTPTDAYLISKEASEASARLYRSAPLWLKILQPFAQACGRLLPNAKRPAAADDGSELYYMDGLVVAQGPNYAWAKRVQQWRAVLARKAGCVVSINIAPATATLSVVHNKTFANAYKGMRAFAPMEIFYQETSLAVMGALLLYDISSGKAAGNTANKLANPMALMSTNAFHGGAMRCPYMYTSLGEVAVLVFYVQEYRLLLAAAAAGAVAAVAAALSM